MDNLNYESKRIQPKPNLSIFILGGLSTFGFALPFFLFALSRFMHPGTCMAGVEMALPSIAIWIGTLITGLYGSVSGIRWWVKNGPSKSNIAATMMSVVPLVLMLSMVIYIMVRKTMQ